MKNPRGILLILVALVAITFLVRHGMMAMRPSRPSDMPADSTFVQSGYDIGRNEFQGNWVACGADREQQTNWCRVTDNRGDVLFQGDFVPLTGGSAVSPQALIVGTVQPEKLWVHGPAEDAPVPVIPLAGGTLLVPVADREALSDRWSSHPEEFAGLAAEKTRD